MPTVLALFDDELSLTRAQDALATASFDNQVKEVIDNRGNRGTGRDTGTVITPPGAIAGGNLAGSNMPGGNLPATGLPAGNVPGGAVTNQAGQTAPTGLYNTLSGYDMNEEEAAFVEQVVSKGGTALIIETNDVASVTQLLRQHGAQRVFAPDA